MCSREKPTVVGRGDGPAQHILEWCLETTACEDCTGFIQQFVNQANCHPADSKHLCGAGQNGGSCRQEEAEKGGFQLRGLPQARPPSFGAGGGPSRGSPHQCRRGNSRRTGPRSLSWERLKLQSGFSKVLVWWGGHSMRDAMWGPLFPF